MDLTNWNILKLYEKNNHKCFIYASKHFWLDMFDFDWPSLTKQVWLWLVKFDFWNFWRPLKMREYFNDFYEIICEIPYYWVMNTRLSSTYLYALLCSSLGISFMLMKKIIKGEILYVTKETFFWIFPLKYSAIDMQLGQLFCNISVCGNCIG